MPAANHEPGASLRKERARVLSLLREALEVLDTLGKYPDLGARLNDIIESLREENE